jgi:hypothetical protein
MSIPVVPGGIFRISGQKGAELTRCPKCAMQPLNDCLLRQELFHDRQQFNKDIATAQSPALVY